MGLVIEGKPGPNDIKVRFVKGLAFGNVAVGGLAIGSEIVLKVGPKPPAGMYALDHNGDFYSVNPTDATTTKWVGNLNTLVGGSNRFQNLTHFRDRFYTIPHSALGSRSPRELISFKVQDYNRKTLSGIMRHGVPSHINNQLEDVRGMASDGNRIYFIDETSGDDEMYSFDPDNIPIEEGGNNFLVRLESDDATPTANQLTTGLTYDDTNAVFWGGSGATILPFALPRDGTGTVRRRDARPPYPIINNTPSGDLAYYDNIVYHIQRINLNRSDPSTPNGDFLVAAMINRTISPIPLSSSAVETDIGFIDYTKGRGDWALNKTQVAALHYVP